MRFDHVFIVHHAGTANLSMNLFIMLFLAKKELKKIILILNN